MKKQNYFFILIILIISFFVSQKYNYVELSNMQTDYCYKDGYFYCMTKQGDSINLLKLDKDGKLIFCTKQPKYTNGFFYDYGDLIVNENGEIYGIRYLFNSKDYYIYEEEIVRYDESGKLDKVIVKDAYSNSEDISYTKKINKLYFKEGELQFVKLDANNKEISAYKLFEEDYRLELLNRYNLNTNMKIDEFAILSDSEFIISTKRGELYKISKGKDPLRLYPQSEDEMSTICRNLEIVDNTLYFEDVFNKSYYKMSLDNLLIEKIYSKDYDIIPHENITFEELTSFAMFDNHTFAGVYDKENNSSIFIKEELEQNTYIEEIKVPSFKYIYVYIFSCIILGILYGALYILIEIVVRMTNGKIPIIIKQIIIFIPILIGSSYLLLSQMDKYFTTSKETDIKFQLYILAQEMGNKINGDTLDKITSPRDYMSKEYQQIMDEVGDVNENGFSEQVGINYENEYYYEIHGVDDGRIYTVVSSEDLPCYYPIEYLYSEEQTQKLINVVDNKKTGISEWSDQFGDWIFAVSPIINREGEVVGIFELGMGKETFLDDLNAVYRRLAMTNASFTLLMVLIFIGIVYFMLSPLMLLKQSASEIAVGNLDINVDIHSKDEIEDLGKIFNQMTNYLRKSFNQLQELNEVYYKFVPFRFIELLGKKNILDVKLGDQVQQKMIVMSLQLRDFYKISNTLNTEENFSLINNTFNTYGSMITENNGVVERYEDAGILSLYQEDKEQAIDTAISIIRKMNMQNKMAGKNGEKIVDIGVAIHEGDIMLGIIGQKERMSARAISEDVSAAMMLQKISKKLGSYILVSDNAMKGITTKYNYRYLGKVYLKELEKEIGVYDFFDGDDLDIRKKKLETKKEMEEGISLFEQKNFYEARKRFIHVTKINHLDDASKMYLFLSDKYSKDGVANGWNSSLHFD